MIAPQYSIRKTQHLSHNAMTLDPAKTDAELLAMLESKQGRQPIVRLPRRATSVPVVEPDATAIVWPVRLTLPWSYLISDNRRHGVLNGRILLTEDYRRAKGLVRDLAKDALGQVEPAAFPLQLDAQVWVPDKIRAHDCMNFAKCCHDALETIVYANDKWLYLATWRRAGTDVDRPRAELVIRPLAV